MPSRADVPNEAWFYHLEHGEVADVLPELLEKTLARGWRALVRSTDQAMLERLDNRLWTYSADGFLGHGRAEEPHASRQPILLTTGETNDNLAQALFMLDEPPADVADYDRCIVIFEGRDTAALERARRLWSRYKTTGAVISYWKQQETRGWQREA